MKALTFLAKRFVAGEEPHEAVAVGRRLQSKGIRATFDKLGEDVAAAVVLADGAKATEREIRTFAAERLAPFKVPRKIVFCDEIPKGATGKIQRIQLASKLGLG